MIDEPRTAFPRERVRTSWQILIGAALFKAVFLAWQIAAASGAGGGYGLPAASAYGTPDGPRAALAPDIPGLLGLAAIAAVAEGCYSLVVAAFQRRALRRAAGRAGAGPGLRGWILGSGAAAALATAPGWFVFVFLNEIADRLVDPVAALALLGGTAAEVAAIAALQRHLLARAARERASEEAR